MGCLPLAVVHCSVRKMVRKVLQRMVQQLFLLQMRLLRFRRLDRLVKTSRRMRSRRMILSLLQ